MHAVRNMWVLLVAAMIVPTAVAQNLEAGFNNPTNTPTPVTMYVHLNDFQDAPINTQKPDDRYAQSSSIGLVQHSQGCFENPGGALLSEPHHTYYSFSSPGYVQYDVDEGGKPRYHNERGISYDVKLAPDDVNFVWYLETQATSGDNNPDPNQLPLVVPNVIMRATIREGDDISVGSTAYNEGELVAQGQSEMVTLAAQSTPDNPHVTYIPHDGKHLYEFRFPLSVERNTVRGDEGFNLRVDVFMDNPLCNEVDSDEYLMPDFVRVHTSQNYRPTFEWTVLNPIRVEYLHPQAIGDDLVVHASMNSAFGNYDVLGDSGDAGATPMIEITGPSIPVNLEVLTFAEHFGNHGPETHIQAVNAAWGWPTVQEKARPGEYTVSIKIQNDQESAEASAVAKFQIGSNHRVGEVTGCGGNDGDNCLTEEVPENQPVEESPGLGFVALLGLLGAIGVALRRKN
ncbi:MAG: hypothetical protein ACPHID_06175 [Thermoplasmatota archaeon]